MGPAIEAVWKAHRAVVTERDVARDEVERWKARAAEEAGVSTLHSLAGSWTVSLTHDGPHDETPAQWVLRLEGCPEHPAARPPTHTYVGPSLSDVLKRAWRDEIKREHD